MSQTCYFFLWMQPFLDSYNLIFWPPLFPSHPPLLIWPLPLVSVLLASIPVYFCPVWPASFLYVIMKLAFLFSLSFSACLALVSVDALPPSDSCLWFLHRNQSPHLTRVTAAGPCPEKRHPTGGWRGDEGLKDNPRYIQDPPVERSHVLYWYLGCRRQAGSYRDYSVKLCCVVVLPGCFIGACWRLYLCNPRKHRCKCIEGWERGGKENWVG